MKVALDLRRNTWFPEYGLSRYARSLYGALDALALPDLDVRPIDVAGSERWPADRRIEVRAGVGMGRRIQQEQLDMRPALGDVDLLHLPWYEGPVAPPVPFVFNLHDLDTLVARATYRWRFRAYYNTLLRVYVRRARRVITGSQASAAAIAQRWPKLVVDVIPNGVDAIFTPNGPAPTGAPEEPFLFYAGGFGPRKRIDDLISAFEILRKRHPELRLVLTGSPSPEAAARISRSSEAGGIVFPGFLEDDELAAWYRAAAVVVYPSLLEGFGLPVVEAFASGTPLVATEVGSIPEVAGDAGMLVPVGDVAALSAAVDRLLGSGDARREQVELGLARARHFRWDTVAAATVESYRAALT